MNTLTRIVLLISALVSGEVQAADETVLWKEDVRGWTIKVDRTTDNGCFMFASYEGGSILRAQFDMNDGTFDFFIGNSDWRSIEYGKSYDTSLQFGSRKPWKGEAEGYWFGSETPALLFSLSFGDEGSAVTFIEEFMETTSLRVRYEGKQIANLSLKGTYAAMQEMFSCQQAMVDAVGSDPFAPDGGSRNDPFR